MSSSFISHEGIKKAFAHAKRMAEGEVDVFKYTSTWVQDIDTTYLSGSVSVCLTATSTLAIFAYIQDGVASPLPQLPADHTRVPFEQTTDPVYTAFNRRVESIFLMCFGSGILYVKSVPSTASPLIRIHPRPVDVIVKENTIEVRDK